MTEQRLALVTGAAQGIGYACAEALAEDNARVILVDINKDGVEAAAKKLGNGAVGLVCDVGDPQQILALFDKIESEQGNVETLVNNAGIAKPGDFLSYDLNDFERVIDINLKGVFVATQCNSLKLLHWHLQNTTFASMQWARVLSIQL